MVCSKGLERKRANVLMVCSKGTRADVEWHTVQGLVSESTELRLYQYQSKVLSR